MCFIQSCKWKVISVLIIAVTSCQALEQEIGEECTNKDGIVGFCELKNKCSKDMYLGAICNSEQNIICCAKNINKQQFNSNDNQKDQLIQAQYSFIPDFFNAPISTKNPPSNIKLFNHQRHLNFVGNVLNQNLNIMQFVEDRYNQNVDQDAVTKSNIKKDISTRPINENVFDSDITTKTPNKIYNYTNYETLRPNRNKNSNNYYLNHQSTNTNNSYYNTRRLNQNQNNNNNYQYNETNQENNNDNNYSRFVSQRPNKNQQYNNNRLNYQTNQNNNSPSFESQNNYNIQHNEYNSQHPNTYINSNENINNYHPTSSSIHFPDDSTNDKYNTKFTTTTKQYYGYQNKPNEKTKRISEIKCEEYSRPLTTTISALPLSIDTSPKPVSVEKCTSKSVELIVGGTKAELGEFPHMVAIGFSITSLNSWNCGGTLISEQFVLTAAHCTHSSLGQPVQVRLGELNLKKNNDGANPIDYLVDEIIIHPDYVSTSKYNDIALIRLNKPVKFNNHIRPACLYNNNNISLRKVTATGWGSIAYGDRSSDDLLKVDLDVIDNQQCNKLYEAESKTNTLNRGIIDSMVCAGDLEGGHDTCLGDSGGPLVMRSDKNTCVFNLIGITSFGKFCATENSPGVYTKVATFLPWIEQIVWP